MTSLMTNTAAIAALDTLRSISASLGETQKRVSSGYKVETASDNAAYWSIATTMSADSMSLSSAEDATGLSAALADTAALGMEAATSIVADIQSKLILAQAVGSNRSAVNAGITQLKEQLGTIARSSGFNGQNWLNLDAGQQPKIRSMVASVSSNGNGDVSVNVIDFDTAKSTLISGQDAQDGLLTQSYSGMTKGGVVYDYHLLDARSAVPVSAPSKEIAVSDTTTSAEFDGMIAAMNTMMTNMIDASASLGVTRSRISSSTEFLQDLQDITQVGIGRLVDADMEEEAAKLSAQKVQQQLQSIGLNIANNSMGASLKLFV